MPRLALCFALLLTPLAGCDDGAPSASPADAATNDTNDTNDTDAASATDVAETTAPTDAPTDGLLPGRWAQLLVQSALTEVPFVGEATATTRTHLLLDVTETLAGFALTQTVCAVDLDSGTDLVRTVLPDAAVAAIAPTTRALTVVGDDGAITLARLTEVWGAVLDDPEADPLPTSPTDPRVVDHEPDGNPGMTVRIAGLLDGEVYVVQRGSTALEGLHDGAGRIDGLVTWTQEQSILGADNPLLETPLPTRVNPDPAASWFRTTRVAADTDCAAVIAHSEALFAR